jgi:tetratricopeptide (TPR) repeat protein
VQFTDYALPFFTMEDSLESPRCVRLICNQQEIKAYPLNVSPVEPDFEAVKSTQQPGPNGHGGKGVKDDGSMKEEVPSSMAVDEPTSSVCVNENVVRKLEGLSVDLESISDVAEANEVFQIAIWLAFQETNRITKECVNKNEQYTQNRSLRRSLQAQMVRVTLVTSVLRVVMAIKYVEQNDVERQIACCSGARHVLNRKHIQKYAQKMKYQNNIPYAGLVQAMMERLELAETCLLHRQELLGKINEFYDASIHDKGSRRNSNASRSSKTCSIIKASAKVINDDIAFRVALDLEKRSCHSAMKYLSEAVHCYKVATSLIEPTSGRDHRLLGRLYHCQGQNDLSFKCFQDAASIFRASEDVEPCELGSTLNDIASHLMLRGEYGLAVQTLRDALDRYKKLPLISELIDCWVVLDALKVIRNLGDSYVQEKEFTLAKSMYKKALNLQFSTKGMYVKNEQLGLGGLGLEPLLLYLISDESIGETYLRICNVCFLARQYNEALVFLSDALSLVFGYTRVNKRWRLDAENHITDAQRTLSRILFYAAEASIFVGQYENAIAFYENATEIHHRIRSGPTVGTEDEMFDLLCSFGIANVHCRCLDYRKALDHYNKLVNFEDINDSDILGLIMSRRMEIVKKLEVIDISKMCSVELIRLDEKLDLLRKTGDGDALLAYLDSTLRIQKTVIADLNQAGLNAKQEMYALVHILQQIEKAFDFLGDSEGSYLAHEESKKLLDQLIAIGSYDDFVVDVDPPCQNFSLSINVVGYGTSLEHEFLEF